MKPNAAERVVGCVEAHDQGRDLPLDLRDIPPGQTASYREIARRGCALLEREAKA